MPVHDFSFRPRKPHTAGQVTETTPSIPKKIPGHPDLDKETTITFDPINTNTPEDIRSILPIGFYGVDEGVLKYFSGIIIPTKDDQREMKVRIAGGDKTFLYWKQQLDANRIQLPVMSINRTGFRWDATRFTPPYRWTKQRFVNSDGSRAALMYRPWPCQVDYTFSIWGERKRDVEYATYQIVTRFNPLAELKIEYETVKGNIRGKLGDVTDSSDIDIGANELAKVRYDLSSTWEAWLPLPEKVVPTILGRVGIVAEDSGVILDIAEFNETGGINAGLIGGTTASPIEENDDG